MQSAPSQGDHRHEKIEILPSPVTMEMATMHIEAEIIVSASFSSPPATMGKVSMEKGLRQGGVTPSDEVDLQQGSRLHPQDVAHAVWRCLQHLPQAPDRCTLHHLSAMQTSLGQF
jgi:hypothetical protein